MKKSRFGYAERFAKDEKLNKFKFLSTFGECVNFIKNLPGRILNKAKNYPLFVMLLVVFFVGAFFAYKIYCMYITNFLSFEPVSEQRDAWGQMGDFFGGMLNPIFSFLGLIFLLVTIYQNQRELNLSRLELKESKEALEDQAVTLKKQKFEDTFFSLLDQLNHALEKISEKKSDCDYSYINMLTIKYISEPPVGRFSTHMYHLQGAKDQFINENQHINQYFRILYQLLKFIATKCNNTSLKEGFSSLTIKNSDASTDELFYSNIVRAFIIEDLHYLLAINCYASSDNDQFMTYRRLLERYRFLEHMNLKYAFSDKHSGVNCLLIHDIVEYYDIKAFGNNIKYSSAVSLAQSTRKERCVYFDAYVRANESA